MASSTLLGAHIDPPLAEIPLALQSLRMTVFQTVLRSPHRLSREGTPDETDQEAYVAASRGLWGIAHASLLTNLASLDPRIRNGSAGALAADANLAARLGLQGVCFHVGYAKGHADRAAAVELAARKLGEVAAKLAPGARVLLENGAEGTELAQDLHEMAAVLRASGVGPEAAGIVLDTCHLHVAGRDLAASDAPRRLADDLQAAGLLDRLVALHLNDAQQECGSHRDRHAPPGAGTIGAGLRALREHPAFADLPCVMELPAAGVAAGLAFLGA